MKIGKYPVKHTYSIARLVADVISLALVVLMVSSVVSFFEAYDSFYSSMALMSDTALETLLANDPNYQWKQWLIMIFPALMLAVLAAYIVYSLKSHKLSRYNVTKKNAQQCSNACTFCASLVKIPVQVIIIDYMMITQDKLIWDKLSWFSITSLLYLLIIAIIVRYTMHRLDRITAEKPAEDNRDTIKVKAVAVKKNEQAASETAADDDKEKV